MSVKKKIDLFLFYYGCLFLLEFGYMLLTFDTILRSSLINIILFLIPVAGVLTLITSLFNDRVNKILAIVIFGILGLWYNIYYVFEAIFNPRLNVWGHFWFLPTLLIIYSLSYLILKCYNNKMLFSVILAVLLAISVFPINTNWLAIKDICLELLYFCIGI